MSTALLLAAVGCTGKPSDEAAITALVQSLFDTRCASLACDKEEDVPDFSGFWAGEDESLAFFERDIRFKVASNEAKGIAIVKNGVELTLENLTLDGDKATVTAQEDYTYISNLNQKIDPDLTSGWHIPFEISLRRTADGWKITEIAYEDDASAWIKNYPDYTVDQLVALTLETPAETAN